MKATEKFYKETPFFTASCDHFGYIDRGQYKDVQVLEDGLVMEPYSYDFTEAITALHNWIEKNLDSDTKGKVKFEIRRIDGTIDKKWDDQIGEELVYSITASKARKIFNLK